MNKGYFSFTALSVLVGGLAIIGLLLYGWSTGQSLPLWPALLVVGVNVVLAVRLVLEIKAKRANRGTQIAPPNGPNSGPNSGQKNGQKSGTQGGTKNGPR